MYAGEHDAAAVARGADGAGVSPQFRYIDYHASDNSGSFKIVVSG